jgi:hypothetical protein
MVGLKGASIDCKHLRQVELKKTRRKARFCLLAGGLHNDPTVYSSWFRLITLKIKPPKAGEFDVDQTHY